jgi:hypothetical protein
MAWIFAGVGIWYLLETACDTVYNNTVKPISDWVDQMEQENLQREYEERKKVHEKRMEESRKRADEIRARFNIPKPNPKENNKENTWW